MIIDFYNRNSGGGGDLSGYTTTATTAELSAATSGIAVDLETLSAYTENIQVDATYDTLEEAPAGNHVGQRIKVLNKYTGTLYKFLHTGSTWDDDYVSFGNLSGDSVTVEISRKNTNYQPYRFTYSNKVASPYWGQLHNGLNAPYCSYADFSKDYPDLRMIETTTEEGTEIGIFVSYSEFVPDTEITSTGYAYIGTETGVTTPQFEEVYQWNGEHWLILPYYFYWDGASTTDRANVFNWFMGHRYNPIIVGAIQKNLPKQGGGTVGGDEGVVNSIVCKYDGNGYGIVVVFVTDNYIRMWELWQPNGFMCLSMESLSNYATTASTATLSATTSGIAVDVETLSAATSGIAVDLETLSATTSGIAVDLETLSGSVQTVSVQQELSAGTKIATVSIGSTDTDLYAPAGGGGGGNVTIFSFNTLTASTTEERNAMLQEIEQAAISGGGVVYIVEIKNGGTTYFTYNGKSSSFYDFIAPIKDQFRLINFARDGTYYLDRIFSMLTEVPTASSSTVGGAKVNGSGLTIDNKFIKVNVGAGLSIDNNGALATQPNVVLSQAQYDALVQAGTVDPNTIYTIV